MRSFLLVIALLGTTCAIGAEPCKYIAMDIGSVKPEASETAPGPALFKAVADNPGCEVVAVNFTTPISGAARDQKRLFYDSRQRLLVLLTRTLIQGMADSFAWRIWHNVKPADFKDGMPYGREDLKTTGSPWESPEPAFAQAYKGPKEATVWP